MFIGIQEEYQFNRERIMNRIKSILAGIFIALLVAACGGGGGGGGGNVIGPLAGVEITADNAVDVTDAVLDTLDIVEGTNEGTGVLTGVAVSTDGDGFNYRDFALAQLDKFTLVKEQQFSSGVIGVELPPTPFFCNGIDDTDGTFTVSGEINDETFTVLSTGDVLSLVFDACNFEGIVFDGGLVMTVAAISDGFIIENPPSAFDMTLSLVMDNLSITDGLDTFTGDGDQTLMLSDDGFGNISATMSGTSLTATAGGETTTLSNYTYVMTVDSLLHYTLNMMGIMESTILGGTVDFITEVDFEGDGEGNPTVGTLLITSTFNDSTARLFALEDGINVQIDVDEDGDGIVDVFITDQTWADLEL